MLKSFKKIIQRRIEKNTVKSTLTWRSFGEEITEVVLLKRSKMPLIGDWGRIYPPINEDGSLNLINLLFGGKKNFIRLVIIIGILTLIYFWIMGILGAGAEYLNGDKYIIMERPTFDKFCSRAISEGGGSLYNDFTKNNLTRIIFENATG